MGSESAPELAIVVVNLLLGLGLAWPLSRHASAEVYEKRLAVRYGGLVTVYAVECFALVLGMGIPLLNLLLAFVWGVLQGRRLRPSRPQDARVRYAGLALGLYSSGPVLSFLFVPLVMAIAGWPVTTTAGGTRMGIPSALPWPLDTILGFYAACSLAGAALKTWLTAETAAFAASRFPRKREEAA